MRARGWTLRVTVQLNGWSLDLSDPLDAALYALHHSPVVRRWAEYPQAMRDAWRTRFGTGWGAQMMLPPALEALEPELTPAQLPEPARQLPERDVRPPDLPPVPSLPPAGSMARPARKRATPAGLPF